jgi:hypothetical protein
VDVTLLAVVNASLLDVSSLDDDELAKLLASVDALAVKARAEQGARRRQVREQRLLRQLGARASCVFCRRVYGVNAIAAHLIAEHRDAMGVRRRRRAA